MASRSLIALAVVLGLGLLALLADHADVPVFGKTRVVDKLVARNVAARGGADAWRSVSSLRLTGRMDVGQGMRVPYVLEQKRPTMMRLEFEFDGETAIQSSNGETGWKLVPFRGRPNPEPMTETELRESADSGDPYGLLFDYAARGYTVELLGQEEVEGRDAYKLKVTLPHGAVRWVYLDTESALEVKSEAMRSLAGTERRVETFYRNWQETDGLLIPRRQETWTEGTAESHVLTVDRVVVNPQIDDSRFAMPGAGAAGAQGATDSTTSPSARAAEPSQDASARADRRDSPNRSSDPTPMWADEIAGTGSSLAEHCHG
jgi:outer membrane lipoprotein-sorting protein